MKWLDRVLQNMRIQKAKRFIKAGAVVLDIGSDDGRLFEKVKRIRTGIGIEPNLNKEIQGANYRILPGLFPAACPTGMQFDTITLLAVLEHIPAGQQDALATACYDALQPGGKIIITVPSPSVDQILAVLKKLRLVDGMSLEEHYGFKTGDTTRIFAAPRYALVKHEKFQFGLNNLFVFKKTI